MEKQNPGFLEKALDNLPALLEYAEVLIQSGKLPIHFYECDEFKNPKKNAELKYIGNASLVVAVIQFGLDMGMTVTESIRHLIPMRGVFAMKGDGAKGKIFASGAVETWEETNFGTIEEGTFQVTISSTRKNGIKKAQTFTVDMAKRMGLWVTKEAAEKHPYLKKSPWYKNPERMIYYRALGFISRDLYPDVLNGIYLSEEALDLEEDYTSYKSESGLTITPEKEEKVEASNKKVLEGIKAKEEKRQALLEPKPIEQPKPIKEQPKQEGSAEDIPYFEKLKKTSPLELVIEFKEKMPFTIEKWVKLGGKKDARTIVFLLNAKHEKKLDLLVAEYGIDYSQLIDETA
jgi:hypothetical protein